MCDVFANYQVRTNSYIFVLFLFFYNHFLNGQQQLARMVYFIQNSYDGAWFQYNHMTLIMHIFE